MRRQGLARVAKLAAPFLLLELGAWALFSSPWPTIWGLMLHGRHVTAARNWSTIGLGTAAAACFTAALALSYTMKRPN